MAILFLSFKFVPLKASVTILDHTTVSQYAISYSHKPSRDTSSITLDRVEKAAQIAVEQHLTGGTSDDDPSTIISTSERIPHIVDVLLESSFTSESTCPSVTRISIFQDAAGIVSENRGLALLGSY